MKKYLFFIPALLILMTAGAANAKVNAQDSLVFDLSGIVYNGDYASVPVYIQSDDTVFSLDFSTKFDEAGLAYDSTLNQTNYLSALANFNTTDRTYRFTSNSLQRIENNKTLVFVRFIMLFGKSEMHAANLLTTKGYLNGDPCSIKIIDGLTTGVKTLNSAEGFTLYPNPAKDILNISVPERATVVLTDMNGQVMMESNLYANQKQEINTSNFANGVYMMKIFNDRFTSMKKVIIQK